MRATTILLALTCLLLPACGDGEGLKKIGEGLEQTWDGVKTFTIEQRGQAETFFSESLEGMDEQLAAAKEKAAALGDDASGKLQAQWTDVQAKLDTMKSATGEEWENARDAFVAAYETFQTEIAK